MFYLYGFSYQQEKDHPIEHNQIRVETTYGTNKNDFDEFGWINSYTELLRVFCSSLNSMNSSHCQQY
jgi:hypothetical protein